MPDEEFLREAQNLIQRVLEAETSNFVEIAKIAGINLKEDLVGADLSGFDLSNADLSNADLSNAKLVGTNLSYANLRHANLSNTNLKNANLTNADLSDVRLSNTTNLTNANLTKANLIGANFLTAIIRNTILKDSKVRHEYAVIAKIVASYVSYSDTPASDLRNFNQLVASLGSVDQNDAEVEEFKNFVREEAQSLGTEENSTISQLFKRYLDKAECLEQVELVFAYRQEIEEIEQAYKACKEASIWLSNKRAELVEEARNLILEDKVKREDTDTAAVPLEQLERFCQSVNIYLLWIENHTAKGSVPTPLPKGVIALALPANDYVKAFKFIRDYKISNENSLSKAAIKELRGYFNRFIIKPLLQS
jgi:uncharacterized protein YjbI with pentapeptide repeats